MSGKWVVSLLVLGLMLTLLNLAILVGQISGPASARTAGASKLLDDEDFTDGLGSRSPLGLEPSQLLCQRCRFFSVVRDRKPDRRRVEVS